MCFNEREPQVQPVSRGESVLVDLAIIRGTKPHYACFLIKRSRQGRDSKSGNRNLCV